jgi:uncharacterized protein
MVTGGAAPVGIGWRHPHYRELIERQPGLDFLEVHSENFFAEGGAALAVLRQGRASYPISLHGVGLSLGSAIGIDAWHLDQLARLVQQIEPVRVSDHACFARGFMSGAMPGSSGVHASDLLPIPFTPQALDVLYANVQRVQDRLQRRFMVENLSAYVSWKPGLLDPLTEELFSEPAFLSELARRTGCALLVDVNNLYVNALNAQIASADGDQRVRGDPVQHCLDWLDGIAPASVGELHLAGHCRVSNEDGDIVIDDHGSRVCDAVWRIYQHAVQRFGPVPTLVEWDTDVPALDVLLQEADRARAVAAAVTAAVTAPAHGNQERRVP